MSLNFCKMTGLWAFEVQMPYQKYQGPPIVVRLYNFSFAFFLFTAKLFRKSSNYLNYFIPNFPRMNRYIKAYKDIKIAMGEVHFHGTWFTPSFWGVLKAWMTFKKIEIEKTLRNGLNMSEMDPRLTELTTQGQLISKFTSKVGYYQKISEVTLKQIGGESWIVFQGLL